MDTWREIVRNPDVRGVEAGWGLSLAGDLVATVAGLVYAYNAGGAAWVAAFLVLSSVSGVGASLVQGHLADRVDLLALTRWLVAISALTLGAAAAGSQTSMWPGLVLALIAVATAVAGTYRAAQSVALPWIVTTPGELAAANITATGIEGFASLVGPLLAGGILLVAGPDWSLWLAAVLLGATALPLIGVQLPRRSAPASAPGAGIARQFAEGFAAFVRQVPPGGVALLVVVQTFARGLLGVLLVVVVLDVLALGDGSVGWYTAALGLGGMLGVALSSTTIRITRVGRAFVAGIILWGVGLIVTGASANALVVLIGVVVIGVGNAVEDSGLLTLVPRLAGPRLAGRAFGAAEVLAELFVAAGAFTAPYLANVLGPRGALVLAGVVTIASGAAYSFRFAAVDRQMVPYGDVLAMLRQVAFLASLPLVVVEQLAAAAARRSFVDATVIIREGEPGDTFHVVTSGRADVTVNGARRPSLRAGDGFGEIALLRDIPRTATVVAARGLETLELARPDFLSAVAATNRSSAAVQAVVADRLDRDHPLQ